MAEAKTPEQLNDERRRDVMAFAYRDTDGKLYTIDPKGRAVTAEATARALSPKYQAIAERTAAVVMMYDKVLAISPEQRSILGQVMNGRADAEKGLNGAALELWTDIKKTTGMEVPGAGIVDGLGRAKAGMSILPTFVSELFGAAGDVANQFGGRGISRDNAIAIGTAYASARQVAAEERPGFLEGFTKGHFWSNVKALFTYMADAASEFLQHAPIIGPFIKGLGLHKGLSLAEHMELAGRGNDNVRVEHEMRKLPAIGGVGTMDLTVLTRPEGGIVRDAAGKETPLAPADKNNDAPDVKLPNGAPTPTTPDAAAAARKENELPLPERTGNAIKNSDFSGTIEAVKKAGPLVATAGVAASAAIATQAVRGAAEGYGAQAIKSGFSASDAAEKAQAEAAKRVAALQEKVAAQAGKAPGLMDKVFGSPADKLANAIKAEAAANVKAEQIAAKVLESTADKGRFAAAGLQKIEGGFWKTTVVDSWRYMGRAAGKLTNMAISTVEPIIGGLKAKEAEALAKVAENNAQVAQFAKAAIDSGAVVKSPITYLAPVVESGNLIYGLYTNNQRMVKQATWAINTITASTVAGAAIGLPVAGVGAIPGAIAGFGAGVITSIGSSYIAGQRYDEEQQQKQQAPAAAPQAEVKPTGALPADPALSVAVVDATQRARAAQAAASSQVKRQAFAVSNSSIGAVIPQADATIAAAHTKVSNVSYS